jgi:hypothetical protein
MPKRIQLRRTKGWRMPANTVKVDRSAKYGNPFRTDMHLDILDVIVSIQVLADSRLVAGTVGGTSSSACIVRER